MNINVPDELFNDEELANTKARYEKFVAEWAKLREDFKFTMFQRPENHTGMVIMKDIAFASQCAHHLLPFTGKAHIGYIPDEKICGASKLVRALEMFASKPQTQEKLTAELIDFLDEKLVPKGVIVILEAGHDCMKIRGVKNHSSIMITSEVRRMFLDDDKNVKEEFLRLIGK